MKLVKTKANVRLSLLLLMFSLACGGSGGGSDAGGGDAGAPAPTSPDINLQKVTGGVVELPHSTGFHDFGNVANATYPGTPGSEVDFRIQNLGTGTLTLNGGPNHLVLGGANPGEFEITQQPTQGSLAGGATGVTGLTFKMRFKPTSNGAKNATVTISSNSPGELSYHFVLRGNATSAAAPEFNLQKTTDSVLNIGSFTSYQFASTAIFSASADITFTIQNIGLANLNLTGAAPNYVTLSGGDASQFQIVSQPSAGTIAPGASLTFVLRFAPSTTGGKSATIAINNNDGDEGLMQFYLSGTAQPTPFPEINVQKVTGGTVNIAHGSGSFAYANTVENVAGPITDFKIQNLGNAVLNLTGTPIVQILGADASHFTLTAQPSSSTIGSGAPGTTGRNFSVQFNPTSAGLKTATISIANDDSDENPYTFTVTGTGVPFVPEIHVEQNVTAIATGGNYAYTTTRVGVMNSVVFNIRNQGAAPLNLSGTPRVAVSGPDAAMFIVSSQPSTPVAASGLTTFTVAFIPSSTGAKSATLTIANNDSDENPYVVNLTGTGNEPTAPCISVVNGNRFSNFGSIASFNNTFYGYSNTTLYYTDTVSMTVGPANPAGIFYARQTNATSNIIFTNMYTVASSATFGFDPRQGQGAYRQFSTMFPYGRSSSEFIELAFGSGSLNVTPATTQTVYFDFNTPVSIVTQALDFSVVRGCQPRLLEEINFTTSAGASSGHGLGHVWQYRKKLNVKLIFIQGTYPTYTVAGIQDAVNRMTSVYAQDTVKLDLLFSATSISAAEFQTITNLANETGTLAGSLRKMFQANTGSAQATDALNIYLTADNSVTAGTLGISSGIPGVPGMTGHQRAGMVVFIEPHRSSGTAGTALIAADLQFLGDTMAHEAGHFLGLFHLNERFGYDAAQSMFGSYAKDALVETPYCLQSRDLLVNGGNNNGTVDIAECSGTGFTNSGALNLMFWVGDGVTAQTQLTGEQGWVLRANPLAY